VKGQCGFTRAQQEINQVRPKTRLGQEQTVTVEQQTVKANANTIQWYVGPRTWPTL